MQGKKKREREEMDMAGGKGSTKILFIIDKRVLLHTSHYRTTLFGVVDAYVSIFAKALIVLFCDVPLKSYSG